MMQLLFHRQISVSENENISIFQISVEVLNILNEIIVAAGLELCGLGVLPFISFR